MSLEGNLMIFHALIEKLLDFKAIGLENMSLESEGGVAKVLPEGGDAVRGRLALNVLAHVEYIHKYWLSMAIKQYHCLYLSTIILKYDLHSITFKKSQSPNQIAKKAEKPKSYKS